MLPASRLRSPNYDWRNWHEHQEPDHHPHSGPRQWPPAAGVSVSLFKIQGGNENLLAEGTTNDDGRITDWFDNPVEMGHYRLTFDIGTWYQERGLDTFFPR